MKHAENKKCHSCSKGKVSDYTYQVNPSKDSSILDKCDSCEDAPCFILKKGLFKCSNKEEECGTKICWQCMLLTVTINDFKVESLDTIPFSKDPVRLCKGSMRQCVSEKMQGNKLIPECWTTCLSKQPLKGAEKEQEKEGSDSDDEEWKQDKIHAVESVYSEFTSCLACYFKWKHFKFGDADYTDYTDKMFNKDENNIAKINASLVEDSKLYKTHKDGAEMLNTLQTNYVKDYINPKCHTHGMKIHGYIPQDQDFDEDQPIFFPGTKRENIAFGHYLTEDKNEIIKKSNL